MDWEKKVVIMLGCRCPSLGDDKAGCIFANCGGEHLSLHWDFHVSSQGFRDNHAVFWCCLSGGKLIRTWEVNIWSYGILAHGSKQIA